MKQFHNFNNGEFVATGKTFDNRAPVNNRVIGQVHEAGQAEVDAAVAGAHAAMKGEWGRMSVVKRTELIHAVADEINRRFDDFLEAELADLGPVWTCTGRPIHQVEPEPEKPAIPKTFMASFYRQAKLRQQRPALQTPAQSRHRGSGSWWSALDTGVQQPIAPCHRRHNFADPS